MNKGEASNGKWKRKGRKHTRTRAATKEKTEKREKTHRRKLSNQQESGPWIKMTKLLSNWLPFFLQILFVVFSFSWTHASSFSLSLSLDLNLMDILFLLIHHLSHFSPLLFCFLLLFPVSASLIEMPIGKCELNFSTYLLFSLRSCTDLTAEVLVT